MKQKLSRRILKYLLYVVLGLALAYGLIWIILQGYSDSASRWTGFANYTKPSAEFVRGKVLWDWMDLLIIPLFIGVGLFLLNRSEKQTELDIAADRQREATLQAYLDKMSELLLAEKPLSAENENAKNVARVRTLTVLRGIDSNRKGIVLRFLYEAGLIEKDKPLVQLSGADFEGVDLQNISLNNTNLRAVNFHNANFTFTDFENANLEEVDFTNATLVFAKLAGANLSFANFENANIQGAELQNSDLQFARLINANLAVVRLENAKLEGAVLIRSDLTAAKVTQEQLAKAGTLEGAIMPDGTRHK
jgi:uncharacterized protein YjbI with pentapeptide repeats